MKIEKRIYKVVCKGKRFSLFLNISSGIQCRQKIRVIKLNPKP